MKRATATRGPGELRSIVVGLLVALALAALVTAVASAFATSAGVTFEDLSRDPAAVANLPNYTGYYANVTIFVWQVPASAALLAAVLLRHAGHRARSRMFLIAGVITATMALDDFFLVHETLNATVGLSQKAEPVAYALAIAAFTVVYRRQLRCNIVLVAVAMGFWGASAALDALDIEVSFLVEDGAKLFGVAVWTFMVMRMVLSALRAVTLRTPEAIALDRDDDLDGRDDEDPDDAGDYAGDYAGDGEPGSVRADPRHAAPVPPADVDPATTPIAIVARQAPRADDARPRSAPPRHGRSPGEVSRIAGTRLPPHVSAGRRIPVSPRPVDGRGVNGHRGNGHGPGGRPFDPGPPDRRPRHRPRDEED